MADAVSFSLVGEVVLPLTWWARLWAWLRGYRTRWYVWTVWAKAPATIPKPPLATSTATCVCVEGPAGIGKTTLLEQDDNAVLVDMAEMFRCVPALARTGGASASAYHLLRQAYVQQQRQLHRGRLLVDRSSWLSNDVYTAYATGHLFLHTGPVNAWLQSLERILVLDNSALSDEEITARIRQRGGLDAAVPVSYTTITRRLFAVAARWYHLPTADLKDGLPTLFADRAATRLSRRCAATPDSACDVGRIGGDAR